MYSFQITVSNGPTLFCIDQAQTQLLYSVVTIILQEAFRPTETQAEICKRKDHNRKLCKGIEK